MTGEIVHIPVDKIGGSQKVRDLDLGHVTNLRMAIGNLPPIVVRPHKREGHYEIIDGSHRLAAHREEGRKSIAAVVTDLGDVEALAAAIHANLEHGKPVTVSERAKAARRLIALDPDRSDRWIAEQCGLSPSTIGKMRPPVQSGHLTTGKDGKSYPTPAAAAEGRNKARTIHAENPDLSDRKLAEAAGVSKGTASKVKQEARNGLRVVGGTDADEPEGATVEDVLGPPVPKKWVEHDACRRTNEAKKFGLFMDRRTITSTTSGTEFDGLIEHCPGELRDIAQRTAELQIDYWQQILATLNKNTIGVAR